jgi:hypothetical protein
MARGGAAGVTPEDTLAHVLVVIVPFVLVVLAVLI